MVYLPKDNQWRGGGIDISPDRGRRESADATADATANAAAEETAEETAAEATAADETAAEETAVKAMAAVATAAVATESDECLGKCVFFDCPKRILWQHC